MKLALRLKRLIGTLLMGGERRSMEIATRVHAHLQEVDEDLFIRHPEEVLNMLEAQAKREMKS